MKAGFVWYELMVNGDLDAAAKFYGDVVGWDVKDSGMLGMKYLLFGKDGKEVGGMMSWNSINMNLPTAWKGHIYTPNVDEETKAVVQDGGKEFRPPQDIPNVGRFSVVGDPQGAEYLLFQPNSSGKMPERLAHNAPGSVGWHELYTTDAESAWEFYSKHYGWTKENAMDMGPMGVYQTYFMDKEYAEGGMMNIPPSQPEARPVWNFYFAVEDVDATAEKIAAAGGKVLHGPMDVPGESRVLLALDPFGGSFALVSNKSNK